MRPTQLLRPLLTNQHWDKMEEYLAGEKSRLVIQLCNCKEEELKLIQGQIKQIDKLLNLRDNLKAEERSKR